VKRRAPARPYKLLSVLLRYPDERLAAAHDEIAAAVAGLPRRAPEREPLERFLRYLLATDPLELAQSYVETFDLRRRFSLYLGWYLHGDTRKRGMALLRFKQTYLASGFALDEAELPDHLCVVLEYAATVDQEAGRQLLLDHRAGLELLRIALVEAGSRWAGVLEAVSATLPVLRGDELDAVRRLAAEGPPAEEVGLTPYGTPQFDAALSERTGSVDLPMPTVRGA
jgi:nitrate reductase delta subunit